MRLRNAVEVRREREREFHNKPVDDRWRRVEKFYDLTESSHALYHGLILERCQGKRVLEYGCGEGSSAFLLAEHGAAVTGIDISDVRIEHAREQAEELGAPTMSFEVMDAEALAFRDSSFELICGTSIIHHLDLARAFSELRRVLTADGVGIFLEPLGHNPLINFYRTRTPDLRTPDEHPLLMRDLELAGRYFGRVEASFFHLASLVAVGFRKTRAFPFVRGRLEALDRQLFALAPPLRRYAWVTVLQFGDPIQTTQNSDGPGESSTPRSLGAPA